jgi:hypothetical protein
MDPENRALDELAQFLNANGIAAQVVPFRPAGKGVRPPAGRGYVEAFQTTRGINIHVNEGKYWATDGRTSFDCPIADKTELLQGIVRMGKPRKA